MLVATGVKACVHRARAACEGKGGASDAGTEERAACFVYSLAGKK